MPLQKPNATAKPAAAPSAPVTKPAATAVKPPSRPPATPGPAPQRVKSRARTLSDGEFDYDDDTASSGGGLSGFYHPGANVQVVRPQWKGTTPLVVRLLPTIDPDDCMTLLPGRKGAGPGQFSQWLYLAEAASYVGIGENKQSFLLFDPRWKRERNYDPKLNPYNLLYYQVVNALDKGKAMLGSKSLNISSWMPLTKYSERDPNKGGLTRPVQMAFMRVFVYQNAEKDRESDTIVSNVYVRGNKPPLGAGDGDRLVILELKRTAFRAQFKDPEAPPDMYTELHRVKTDQPVQDEMDALLWPDPTSLESGPFVTIYRPKKHQLDPLASAPAVVQDEAPEYEDTAVDDFDDDRGRGRGRGRGSGKKGGFESWGVKLDENFKYVGNDGRLKVAPKDLTKYTEAYRSQYLWFDDMFVIPQAEEICEKLARAFKSMPKMLEYAWRDFPEYYGSDAVQSVLRSRSISVPEGDTEDDVDVEIVESEDDVEVPVARRAASKPATGGKARSAKALAAQAAGLSEEMLEETDDTAELPDDESNLPVDQYGEEGVDDAEDPEFNPDEEHELRVVESEGLDDETAAEFDGEDDASAEDDSGQDESEDDVPFETEETEEVDEDARMAELEKQIAELRTRNRAAQRPGSAGVTKAGAAQQEAVMAKKQAAAKAPKGKPAKKASGKPAKK